MIPAIIYGAGAVVMGSAYYLTNRRYARIGGESSNRQVLGSLICGGLWPMMLVIWLVYCISGRWCEDI